MTGFHAIQLEIATAVLGVGTLLWGAFRPRTDERSLGWVLALVMGLLFAWSWTLGPDTATRFEGLVRSDAFALHFKRVFLLVTAFVLVMAAEYAPIRRIGSAECYSLMLIAASGMMFLACANDFILMIVALELVTVTFYVLTSYLRMSRVSLEAGLKYLVIGALSGGTTLYGIAYIFGATGTLQFDLVRAALNPAAPSVPYTFGMALILLGIGFKVASAPTQVWAPDVYEGAPAPVTAFLATGSKLAGVVLLLRLLQLNLIPVTGAWTGVMAVLAAVTLLYGSFGALGPHGIKRLLGYSSITHTGFMLMAVAARTTDGMAAVAHYAVQYVVTAACAFLAIVAVVNATGRADLAAFRGLGRRSPLLAVALSASLLSMAGVPPLSGAFGKFQVFATLLGAGDVQPWRWALAGVGALAVVLAFAYYLPVLREILAENEDGAPPFRVAAPLRLAIALALAGVLILGVFPGPFTEAARAILAP